VYIDREAGIVQAVDHLIQSGRRNLSLMMMGTASKVRIKGFKKALARNNIPFHSGRIIDLRLRVAKLLSAREPLHTLPVESFMNAGYEEARNNTALGTTVDGLLSFDDKVSLGVLRGLAERGVRVPEQIALVGVDDDSYAAYTHVPLSTIRQPIHRVARKVVEMMMAQIQGKTAQSITFPAEFIRRGTA
jgi:DNA-binding LacI/PurR family transcriptional regulator